MKESGWDPQIPRALICTPAQAWESLEEAEYRRELALRDELIRQEKLEQLARRFDRKAAMRETWLNENQRLVAQVVGCTWGCRRCGGRSGTSLSTGLAALLPVIGWVRIDI